MNKLKEFFASQEGKKFLYELKSFLVTFGSVFSLLIAPQLIMAVEASSYDIEFVNSLLGGALIAAIRSFFITVLKLIGVDYRVDTSKYNK